MYEVNSPEVHSHTDILVEEPHVENHIKYEQDLLTTNIPKVTQYSKPLL